MSSELRSPDFAQLVDWVDGRLPAADAARLAAQAGRFDDRTRATVAWLRAFSAARQHAALAAPSARARTAALRAFDSRSGAGGGLRHAVDLLRRLIATPVGAPTAAARLSSVRSAAAAGRGNSRDRRLSYSATGFDILLDVNERRADGLFDIHGQVFVTAADAPDHSTAITAQLLRDDREQALTAANNFGEFVFGAVGAGEYAIVLRLARTEIEVAPVALTI